MKKKVLTMVMALCMVLCLIPTVAYAEGGTGAVAIVENVQALIDALPTAEELEGADEATVNQAYISAQEAYDAIEELEPEELAQLTGVEKLTNLMDWFNGQTSTLAEPAEYLDFDDTTGTVKGLKSGYENTVNVVIPDKINETDVVAIGDGAFRNCTSLKSVTIPSSVTTIGKDAFEYCSSLTSITIMDSEATPSRLTTIGDYAFYKCTGLRSITIPSSVTTIEHGAFEYCSSLTSITIMDSEATPSRLTTIHANAFQDCSSLASIIFPSRLTTIGKDAFDHCNSLTSITIPSSVTTIHAYAFRECTSLTGIHVDDENTSYRSINGVLFSENGTKLYTYPAGKTGAYIIPYGVTTIGEGAFQKCSSLESITIPSSVTTIEDHAFWECTGLRSITIPSSVTTIEDHAFNGCTGLTSVSIPSSVTTIHDNAFRYCTSLTGIHVDDENTCYSSIDGVLFSENGTTLYICPEGKTGAYTIPYGVTTIEYPAFCGCSGLESITIPKTVTEIDNNTFCDSLANVYFIRGMDEFPDINMPNSIRGSIYSKAKFIDVTYAPPSDLVYNGQSKEATVDKNDLTLGDITIKYYDKDKNMLTGSPVDGGRYTVKIDISGSNPYSDIELGNFTITQAPNSFTSDLSIADWTAGETPNSPAATAKYGTPVYSYSTEKDGTYTETVPTAAGSYWVKASVTETASYKGLEAKKQFNILAKPEPVTPTPEPAAPTPEEVTPTAPPQIINGKGQSVTAGEATELSFRSDAAYQDFIRVELDGKTLDEKNYTVREGSTIVTLKAEYVATLSKGEHTISIVSVNGVATTTFTVNEKPVTKSPQTGDDSHIFMWMALLVVSGGLLAAAGICLRKKKFTEE